MQVSKVRELKWYKQGNAGLPETQKLLRSEWSLMDVVWGMYNLHMYQGKNWAEKQIRVNGWIFWPARRKMVALSGALRKALILKSETSH